ncbi:hypothetical protein [Anaerorhabdus sp.]
MQGVAHCATRLKIVLNDTCILDIKKSSMWRIMNQLLLRDLKK